MGPFTEKFFPSHISPFMAGDKSGSHVKCIITDFSWPKSLPVNNVVKNNTYLETQFELHYPSVDDFVHSLSKLGPAAQIFKICIDSTSGSRRGGGSGGFNPPLKNNVKGFNPKYKIIS